MCPIQCPLHDNHATTLHANHRVECARAKHSGSKHKNGFKNGFLPASCPPCMQVHLRVVEASLDSAGHRCKACLRDWRLALDYAHEVNGS